MDMNFNRLLRAGIAALCMAASSGAQEKKEENDPKFHSLLLTAAKTYPAYGLVDDLLRFAPGLCMAPPPPQVRLSASKSTETHGQKLYVLFAWDAAAYLNSPRKDFFKKPETAPIYEKKAAEQVLVKQSWSCVTVGKEEREAAEKAKTDLDKSKFLRLKTDLFMRGEQKDLFIMVKLDENTEGSDKGWVYGTLAPDGKSVTSSGRVQSCMACHERAGAGRLFGLTRDAEKPAGK
jgi:hypothetical protein